MMRRFAAMMAMCCIASIPVWAQSADVNAEMVSYDMQLLRAIRGDASVGSAAVWPQTMQSIERSSRATDDAFARYVRAYYHPWLSTADTTDGMKFFDEANGRTRLLRSFDGTLRFTADASLMLRPGFYDDGTTSGSFLLGRPAMRFAGSFDEHFGFFLDLSNGARLSGTPQMIARTDPVLGRTFKFQVEEQKFFDRYIGYVQYQNDYLRIRYGREPVQFGFSPIDNYVHSLQAAPMDGLLIDVPYKSVRFTSTHSLVEGVDTSGRAVPGKYIATHRIAVDPWPWLSVAVSDMITYWGRGLDLSYLNPLAFFVSAGLGTDERSRNDNSILGFDLAVRPASGSMIYGSLMVDDLSYTSLSDTSQAGNNNKFAFQLGMSQLLPWHVMDAPTLVSMEYARITPFTFSHRSMNASYTHLGAPVGYDMQPNSDRLALQVRQWFTPRTFVRIDLDFTRHGENLLDSTGHIIMGEDPRFPGSGVMTPIGNVGGDVFRGDGDFLQGNRFLRGNVSYSRRVRLWFSAEWYSNIFTDLRIGYENRNGGNAPGSFLYGSFEIRIGY